MKTGDWKKQVQAPPKTGVASPCFFHPFDAVVIAGQTAVGKTAISVLAAKALDAEIISMDSRMVYRGLDIGTDKPGAAERDGVPHHLIDVADPGERFTAADFTAGCREAASAIRARGRLPLIVGGTFLYMNALMKGFNFCGADSDPEVRRRLEAEADERGAEAMRAELARADPEAAARIHPNDRYRVLRALEVLRVAGAPPSSLREKGAPPPKLLIIALWLPRNFLYERINKRVENMYNTGLIKETEGILKEKPHARELLSNVIGYAQSSHVVAGRKTLEEAMEETKKQTRHFARRQMIWLRKTGGIAWANVDGKSSAEAAREIAEHIKNSRGAGTT